MTADVIVGGGSADCQEAPADALLVRPDGYVAWAFGRSRSRKYAVDFGTR